MNRRSFIRNTALSMTTLAAAANRTRGENAAGQSAASTPGGIPAGGDLIDTHVYLSRWPYRRLQGDERPELAAKLKKNGVTSAWAGSFDALLHRDIAAVNIRLAEECAAQRDFRFVPFGALNPTLPDWEEDLRRCHEVHRMPGIRVHPDFHGYKLDDPRFGKVVELATQRNLIVQVALGMDDPRIQPQLAILPPVNPEPLVELLPKFSRARVVLLNFWRSSGGNQVLLVRLHQLQQVSFDMATLETMGGIEARLRAMESLRLVFGSYAPFYNFGSSWRKLHESILTPEQLAAIQSGHAKAILQPA